MKIKIERNHIIAILFMIIIYGMLLGLFVASEDDADKVAGNSEEKNPINYFLLQYRTEVLPGTPIFKRIKEATRIAEEIVSKKSFFTPFFVENYGFIQKVIGKHTLPDAGYGEIYKTKYNQIIFKIDKKDDAVKQSFLKVKELNDELDKLGIPFLYVQAPFKLSGNRNQLPVGRIDYSDYNIDKFLSLLKQNNISYIDLRDFLQNRGKTPNEIFFDTDHHWRIETAFDVTGFIEKNLNENYGFSIDEKYRDIKNYDQKITKKSFLGSMGRRTGRVYAGLDDFNLIVPKFQTDYTLIQTEYGKDTVFIGDFQEAVLDSKYLGNSKSDPKLNRYAVYHGDNEQLVFKNNLIDEGKVMIIKDSFGIPVYSFLSLAVNEVRALDLRIFKSSVVEYAKENSPDIVILMYNGDAFNEEMYNFKGESDA